MLRVAKRTNSLADWETYKVAQRHYKSEIESAKKECWKAYCNSLSGVHPAARVFRALKEGRRVGPRSLRKPDGTYTEGPGDTLDYLLESVAPVQGEEYDELFDGRLWDGGIALLNEAVLRSAVRGLTPGRAPGMDGITPSMLREGWEVLAPNFLKLCMGCLRLGIIPCG